MSRKLRQQLVSEFIGTFALIFVGVGAIYNNPGLLGVAIAHGLAIGVFVTAVGGISGGHLNPAVTFGLWVGRQIETSRAIPYVIAQLAGGTVAGLILIGLLNDPTHTGKQIVAAGTPNLGANVGDLQGIVIEAITTFFLVFVVYGSAVDSRAPRIGGLAIGFTIVLDILFAGPLTGGAMNPARAFGPALASGQWAHQAVYWIGPLLGGGAAGVIYGRCLMHDPHGSS